LDRIEQFDNYYLHINLCSPHVISRILRKHSATEVLCSSAGRQYCNTAQRYSAPALLARVVHRRHCTLPVLFPEHHQGTSSLESSAIFPILQRSDGVWTLPICTTPSQCSGYIRSLHPFLLVLDRTVHTTRQAHLLLDISCRELTSSRFRDSAATQFEDLSTTKVGHYSLSNGSF